MTDRLVLGCGSLGRALVDDVRERRGSLLVVTDDEHRVDTLRSDGVDVLARDPTDESVLGEVEMNPDTVAVVDEDGATNVAAAEAATAVFPDAFLLTYAGRDPAPARRERLETLGDRFVDRGASAAAFALERVGDAGVRLRNLNRILRGVEGRLAVVTHDNPDPDAIASGVALAGVAERTGCETDVCYYGDITHQENRAFVNLLEYDLRNLEPGETVEDYDAVALVDHSRPGVNDGLPQDTPIDVVIDHHPPREPIDARFVDLRSEVGATSTLLVDYLRALQVDLDTDVATGLLFGIRVDTNEFRREVSAADFEAAAHLLDHADLDTLRRIESPTIGAETLGIIGRAIENRRQEGSVLLSGVGEVGSRDALAQAADRLLDLEDVNATLVYGVQEGTIYASARARGAEIDLGETLRDAFGQIGSAGGHADMAGAQITLGVLENIEDQDASLHAIVDDVVTDRFLDALEAGDTSLLGGLYAPTAIDEGDPYFESGVGEDSGE